MIAKHFQVDDLPLEHFVNVHFAPDIPLINHVISLINAWSTNCFSYGHSPVNHGFIEWIPSQVNHLVEQNDDDPLKNDGNETTMMMGTMATMMIAAMEGTMMMLLMLRE